MHSRTYSRSEQAQRAGTGLIVMGLTMIIATAVLDCTAATPNMLTGTATGNIPVERALPGYVAHWDTENTYWQDHYKERPYYRAESAYSDYQPAYRYGMNAYGIYGGKRYEDIDESRLRAGWEQIKGTSQMSWESAKAAVRDAYDHVRAQANQP